ncbi:hypothetical protein [uncultured Psychroserpens sp.]|uniref:hypothetical protein n=1 Tax=uncultured Psychroserpens sp. TaxID=255436 RepID=UPI002603FDD3|nr:hypothetical protein [uncultured Psychroserpens sp.]
MGISSMNAVLRNNRNLLRQKKRKPLKDFVGGYKTVSTYKVYVLPEVPPHVLRRIRIKTRRQNRRLLIKQLIIGVLVSSVILYWFYRFQYG